MNTTLELDPYVSPPEPRSELAELEPAAELAGESAECAGESAEFAEWPLRERVQPPPLREWIVRAALAALLFVALGLLIGSGSPTRSVVRGVMLGVLFFPVAALEASVLRLSARGAVVALPFCLALIVGVVVLLGIQGGYTEAVLKGTPRLEAFQEGLQRARIGRGLLEFGSILIVGVALRRVGVRWRWHALFQVPATVALLGASHVFAGEGIPLVALKGGLLLGFSISFLGWAGERLTLRWVSSRDDS